MSICLHTCLRLRHKTRHTTPSFASNQAAIHSSLPIIQGRVVWSISLENVGHWLRSRRQSRHGTSQRRPLPHHIHPILKSAKSSHDQIRCRSLLFGCVSAANGATGVFNQTGLISSMVSRRCRPREEAPHRGDLRSRSAHPARRIPEAQQTQELHRGVRLATPVSVPIMKAQRLVSPDPTQPVRDSRLSFPSSNGKSLRHLCCPIFPRRRDPGAALTEDVSLAIRDAGDVSIEHSDRLGTMRPFSSA